ncbi:MAG: hypothetical protein KIS77_05940 [Saprospiraceae bacterium]|nr:hypothetical protein [Saprospiraceae bacterium]
MKQNSLPKSLILAAAVFSLTAFVFVNVHANLTIPGEVCKQTRTEQPQQVKECDDADSQELKLPNVTVLGRLLGLAQKLIPIAI